MPKSPLRTTGKIEHPSRVKQIHVALHMEVFRWVQDSARTDFRTPTDFVRKLVYMAFRKANPADTTDDNVPVGT